MLYIFVLSDVRRTIWASFYAAFFMNRDFSGATLVTVVLLIFSCFLVFFFYVNFVLNVIVHSSTYLWLREPVRAARLVVTTRCGLFVNTAEFVKFFFCLIDKQ